MEFKETESIELKRADSDIIEKEIVAFLNTREGTIFIGVEDNGEVVGVDSVDKLHKKYADIITNNILPEAQDLVELGTR